MRISIVLFLATVVIGCDRAESKTAWRFPLKAGTDSAASTAVPSEIRGPEIREPTSRFKTAPPALDHANSAIKSAVNELVAKKPSR